MLADFVKTSNPAPDASDKGTVKQRWERQEQAAEAGRGCMRTRRCAQEERERWAEARLGALLLVEQELPYGVVCSLGRGS